MRRKRLVAAVLAGTVVAGGAGWAAGRTIRSPARVAAETAPPKPSLITVPVERRTLSADVIVRGTVRYGGLQPVTLAPSQLKPGNGILTRAPTPGATLSEGASALTVSGRPVFVLRGAVPTYRDLGPGATGDDVRQLEVALRRLGFDPGPVDGTYGGQTADAVAAWYRARGFAPFEPTDQQRTALASAEAAVSQAQDAVLKARADLDAATNGGPTTSSTASPGQMAILRQRLALAEADLARVTAERDRLRATTGIQVPADEVLFFPVLPLRVDSVKLKPGDAVQGEVMKVSSGRLAVDSALSLTDATLVRQGLRATVEEPNLGITVGGTVTQVAPAPGTNGVDPQHVYLEVTPDQAPAQLVGASVKITIAVKTTAGDVLVVPASALSISADGTARVQVDRGGGRTDFVPVTPGLAAQGLVEVRPLSGVLQPGDLVVVGVRGTSVPQTPPSLTTEPPTTGPGSPTTSTAPPGGTSGH